MVNPYGDGDCNIIFIYWRAIDKSLMIYGMFVQSNLVVFTDDILKQKEKGGRFCGR
ncbi:hypothetical protein G9F72_019365 [Clostridium estertheticum]|uniref:hypothetical protein n=1 Tax=Clostridium estertheticum TaxID=238834 RepID=UPI001CD141B0|nr:hypothetical protein [Clostridium estertheticum]MBZ9688492.1 hypothetical protein [Clostridium estertheticum]